MKASTMHDTEVSEVMGDLIKEYWPGIEAKYFIPVVVKPKAGREVNDPAATAPR